VDAVGLVGFDDDSAQLEVQAGEPQREGAIEAEAVPILVTKDGTDTYLRFAAWPADQPWALLPADESAAGVDGGAPELTDCWRPSAQDWRRPSGWARRRCAGRTPPATG
jgi:hypothetical protein